MFLVEGDKLRGIVSEWDWTRTSFDSTLGDWPTVVAALSDGVARPLTRTGTVGAEAAWFERGGIERAMCIPMRGDGRSVGVLFFDFEAAGGDVDVPFLEDVATRCARALTRPPRRRAA
jgi:GAF domain-containing protein